MWQKTVEGDKLSLITSLKNVKKPRASNVEQGDEVLIVTDAEHDREVWQLLATAVHDLGDHPIISLIEPPEMDYYNPPLSVAGQMKAVDLVVTCTTTAMLHSPIGAEAMEEGVPIICMDGGLTIEMLSKGAASADYRQIEHLEYEFGKHVFEDGSDAHLTSKYGTDLTLSIEDRVFLYRKLDSATEPLTVYEKRPGFKAVVFPRSEFNVPPNPDTANGTIVFDTTMHHVGKLEELELEIDSGTIVDINGGYQASELKRVLEEYGDKDAYRMPTEFSVGANPAARVTGCQREDKNMLGCMHIGLVPGDGGAWLLPRLIGESKAKEYLMTGSDITPEDALDDRLVTEVTPEDSTLEVARDLANTLVEKPYRTVRGVKSLIDVTVSFDDHARLAFEEQWECINNEEHAEAVDALREGRNPDFDRGT